MRPIAKSMMTAAALALAATSANAEISDDVVRIGVMNDQSGLYADLAGEGSVEAVRMAIEDFGGSLDGTPIEVVSAAHQNKPRIQHRDGSTMTAWTLSLMCRHRRWPWP